MAKTSSATSRVSATPLHVSRGTLDRRWPVLSEAICSELVLNRQQLQVQADYASEGVWAGLVGSACERVRRNRGRPTPVVKLVDLAHDLKAWLGIHEVWDAVDSARFRFRHLSITVYFGFLGELAKLQVFRCEWAGIRNWDGSGLNFQSPGAGHPHWQIDLLETLRIQDIAETLEAISAQKEAVDFAPVARRNAVDLLKSATIDRMHFASAAPWWTTATQPPSHMNSPEDERSLTLWIVQCIGYIRQELLRCEFA